MKECFLVTSYCDTEEKVNVLKHTINRLKSLNINICIHAHYPLDVDVQDMVNYYVYDYSNPIINFQRRAIIVWRRFGNLRLNILKADYGYTAVQQVKRGSLFLGSIGYERVHILNYDTIFTDEFFKENNNHIDNKGIYYLNEDIGDVNLLFLTIDPIQYKSDLETIDEEDYKNSNEYWYGEKYLYSKIIENKDNIKVFNYGTYKLDSNIRHQPHELTPLRMSTYNIHAGDRIEWINGEKTYLGKFCLYFYNIDEKIDVKIVYDNKVLLFEIIDDKEIITDIPIGEIFTKYIGKYDNITFNKAESNFTIYVNGDKIGDDILKLLTITSLEYVEQNQIDNE